MLVYVMTVGTRALDHISVLPSAEETYVPNHSSRTTHRVQDIQESVKKVHKDFQANRSGGGKP